jgi:hypothetical protein
MASVSYRRPHQPEDARHQNCCHCEYESPFSPVSNVRLRASLIEVASIIDPPDGSIGDEPPVIPSIFILPISLATTVLQFLALREKGGPVVPRFIRGGNTGPACSSKLRPAGSNCSRFPAIPASGGFAFCGAAGIMGSLCRLGKDRLHRPETCIV